MIDEQLFKRVLDTLKTNNDAVIVAVADDGGKNCKVYLNGSDELLIPMIDTISHSYIEDVIKDDTEPTVNQGKLDNIDEMLQQLQDSMKDTNDSIKKTDELTKEIEDALGEIDWEDLLGEDGIDGKN
jgi:hypothetical protein